MQLSASRGSLAEGSKLEFWAWREQPWGSYQDTEARNVGLLRGYLLMVNRSMRCAAVVGATLLDTGQIPTYWLMKPPKPQCLNQFCREKRWRSPNWEELWYPAVKSCFLGRRQGWILEVRALQGPGLSYWELHSLCTGCSLLLHWGYNFLVSTWRGGMGKEMTLAFLAVHLQALRAQCHQSPRE